MRDVPSCLGCGARAAVPWACACDAEYHTVDETFCYWRCDVCGVLFIDPVPADRLDEIYPSNYYSFTPREHSPVHFVKELLDARVFRKILAGITAPSLRVLDVGGGAGWQLSSVRHCDRRVQHTQIVDLDARASELARSLGHAYFQGRIEDFTPAGRFHFVLLLNLIEHVANPLEVLAKLAAVLEPGGSILVKTPNYDSADARIFRHANWGGYHCPRHWVLFDRQSFTALAARAGLSVTSFSYTQGAPFWSTSILFWLARRNHIRVTRERPVMDHPLYGPLSAAFAAFDFLRMPVAKTSQMFFVLRRASAERQSDDEHGECVGSREQGESCQHHGRKHTLTERA